MGNDLEKDSNSVYLLTKEKNTYRNILIIILISFIIFLIFSIVFLYGKIESIDNKINSMINANEEILEEDIEIDSGDGENANYVEGNNNSINN